MDIFAIPKDQWPTRLKLTQVVGEGSEPTPLVLDDGRLYLYRYWQYERSVAGFLKNRSTETLDTDEALSILQRLFNRDYHFVLQQCKGKSEAGQKAELIKWLDIESINTLDWQAILDSVEHGVDTDLS